MVEGVQIFTENKKGASEKGSKVNNKYCGQGGD